RIQLLNRNADSASLEESSEGGGGYALAERTHDAAGEENVLRHLGTITFLPAARKPLCEPRGRFQLHVAGEAAQVVADRDPRRREGRAYEIEESVHLRRRRFEQQEPTGFEQRGGGGEKPAIDVQSVTPAVECPPGFERE